MAGRIALFDNLKGFAILLVVVGHFTSMAVSTTHAHVLYATNAFIWAYHVPMFMFVSGLFAGRSWAKSRKAPLDKVLMYLVIYIIFWGLLVIFKAVVCNTYNNLNPLYMEKAPWFMLVLALYMLIVPIIGRIPRAACMPVALLVALAANIWLHDPDYLSLGRAFTYLPYFTLGFVLRPEGVSNPVSKLQERIGVRNTIIIGIIGLVVVFVVLWMFSNVSLTHFKTIAAGRYTLPVLAGRYHSTLLMLILRRWAGYLIGCAMIGLTALAVSCGECVLTKWGQRSLQVYMIHIFAIYTCNRFDVCANLAWLTHWWYIGAYVVGVFLTWLLALPAAPAKWIAALGRLCKKPFARWN